MASKWERSRDGRKTFKNSAENIPPFFMTLVFLMLSVAVRLGCLKRNSLILRKKMRSERSYTHLYLWHYQLAQLFHKLRGHSLWGDVLRPAGPIPYPVCIFLQEPFYLSPPFKEVLFGLEQRAMIRQNAWLSEVGISPLKQICSAPKAAHEAAPAARFSHLSLLHTCPITPSIWTLDKCGQRGDGLRAGHEWQRAISHILICVSKDFPGNKMPGALYFIPMWDGKVSHVHKHKDTWQNVLLRSACVQIWLDVTPTCRTLIQLTHIKWNQFSLEKLLWDSVGNRMGEPRSVCTYLCSRKQQTNQQSISCCLRTQWTKQSSCNKSSIWL